MDVSGHTSHRTRPRSTWGLALALILAAGGCGGDPPATTPQAAESASNLRAMVLASGTEEKGKGEGKETQCPTWTYPEMSGSQDNWVHLGCKACGADVPYQSPVALNPASVPPFLKGPFAPSQLSPSSVSLGLTANWSHNNYTFKIAGLLPSPLTMNWSVLGPGFKWQFDDFHFHVPAEHSIVGQSAWGAMEMHVKATASYAGKNYLGVFAVLFEVGANPTPSLAPVAAAMSEPEQPSDQTLDLSAFLTAFQSQNSLLYSGSLTTPPCGQPVVFFVLQNRLQVDSTSLQTITTALLTKNKQVNNVRPQQAFPADRTLMILTPSQ